MYGWEHQSEVDAAILSEKCKTVWSFEYQFNACVAHGGWVPRNLGAGAADPKPW